ncbi:MAG: hypothetical protein ACJA1I_002249 [Zhongshania marina]|jgi:hypothetical protein
MYYFSLALFALLLIVITYLLVRLNAQRRLLLTLQDEQRALAKAWRANPVDFNQIPVSEGKGFIAIKILNPVELATKESVFAGLLNNFAPDVIRSIVYKRTVEIMRGQLEERGVQAEISIHGLD